MKKWLLTLTVTVLTIIVLAAIFLPLATGIIAEKKYPVIVASLSRPGAMQVNLLNYERGWFTSTATFEVKILQPQLLNMAPASASRVASFKLTQEIQHGPWFWVAPNVGTSRLLFGLALIHTKMDPAFGDVRALSLLQLDGSLTNVLEAKALHIEDAQKQLHFQAANVSTIFRLSSDLNQISGAAQIQQANIHTAEFTQTLQGLSGNYQLHKIASGMWVGKKQTQIRSLTWETLDHKVHFSLYGLNVALESVAQANKLNFLLNATVDKLALDQTSYGPQQIHAELRQLDVPTLLLLKKALADFSSEGETSPMQLVRYNQILMQLLSKGLQLNIDKLALETVWGSASASAKIMLEPLKNVAVTPKTLLNALNATVHVSFPATALAEVLQEIRQASIGALAIMLNGNIMASPTPVEMSPQQQVQQQITQWIQNKWIVPKGNGFEVDFIYQNGEGFLNGQAITETPPPISPASAPKL